MNTSAPASSSAASQATGTVAAEHDAARLDREFGPLRKTVVRYHERDDSNASSSSGHAVCEAAAGGGARNPRKLCRAQWRRLAGRLVARRWLRQYFSDPGVAGQERVLIREKRIRTISSEVRSLRCGRLRVNFWGFLLQRFLTSPVFHVCCDTALWRNRSCSGT
jgi:hypothetical protein